MTPLPVTFPLSMVPLTENNGIQGGKVLLSEILVHICIALSKTGMIKDDLHIIPKTYKPTLPTSTEQNYACLYNFTNFCSEWIIF